MTDAREPPEDMSPAEARLQRHLELLRHEVLPSLRPLTETIVRTARWQRAVRAPLAAVGSLGGALADGLRLLLSRGRRGRP